MARPRSLNTFASVFLSSIALLALAACSKCSSGGSTEISKQSYITAQDAICVQTTPASEELAKQLSQYRQDLPDDQRLQIAASVSALTATYHKQLLEALQKAPQPKEDAAIVQELFASQKTVSEKLQTTSEKAKKMYELASKLDQIPDGQDADPELAAQIHSTKQEMEELERDVQTLTQKQMELAKKYGFKSCFLPKQ